MSVNTLIKRPLTTITLTLTVVLMLLTISILRTTVISSSYKPTQYKMEDMRVLLLKPQVKSEIRPANPQFYVPKIEKAKAVVVKTVNPKTRVSPSRGGSSERIYVPNVKSQDIIDANAKMNKYCDKNNVVEISYYSENEPTDIGGYGNLGSTGVHLKNGHIAMPYAFPDYTQVVLKDKDGKYLRDGNGKIKIYTSVDRGSKNHVREKDGANNCKLRIDVYKENMSSSQLRKMGLDYYAMEVIRWGADLQVKVLEE
jgi:hypothetical protein